MTDVTNEPGRIPVQGFRRAHLGDVDEAGFARLVWVVDQQAQAPPIRRIRAWLLGQLVVQPGETAVDVGSGTGHDVQLFAELVGGSGDAVGVEPNARMRTLAEQHARGAGSAARFVDGDAQDLPFARRQR